MQHTFLNIALLLFCTTTTWNFLKCCVCFCSLFYFSLSLIFTLVAASISHFLSAAINFLCFSSNKIRLHCVFIPHSSTLLVFHAIVAIKFKSKKDSALLLFSLSKSPGGHLPPKRPGCLKCENFTKAYMKGGRTDGQFCHNQNFLDA